MNLRIHVKRKKKSGVVVFVLVIPVLGKLRWEDP